eukprot:TRINITY_DN37212_c0_g1_i1.p1 TRINITY_DN37212_c0_g1~~TRINITY_DN37212_c0_g1_i1.p1  ORF type:complete len:761 (-),score=141.86 TRINITY_DN37212_c0_g1_i1:63-2084(-)
MALAIQKRCETHWRGAFQTWRGRIRREVRLEAQRHFEDVIQEVPEDSSASEQAISPKDLRAPPPAAAPPPPPTFAPPPDPAEPKLENPGMAWQVLQTPPRGPVCTVPRSPPAMIDEVLASTPSPSTPLETPVTPRQGVDGLDVAECSGLMGLAARLVSYAADTEVWNETRKCAVKRILEGRTNLSEVKDLPIGLVTKLLRSKGYELPVSGLEVLGAGSFGRVFKVRRPKDGTRFAVKRQALGEAATDVVPVLRETSILNVLKGACNVVQIEDAFLVRPPNCAAEVWTVLEFFPQNLHRSCHRFRDEEPSRRVIFQVLAGLHSLHSADIIHRDLKPENLLVDFGPKPPMTVHVSICDFGMSRSVHGFQDNYVSSSLSRDELIPPGAGRLSRKLSDRVTSCWWRAPEMWGWADTQKMTKTDLKSLDVFALGLVWAGLRARQSVITHEEGVDPPKFRLLEILRKVDKPNVEELGELGFSLDVSEFVCNVLDDNLEVVRAEMDPEAWPENAEAREALLHEPYIGVREWVRRHAVSKDISSSRALDLIEKSSRFSYTNRPTVLDLVEDPYFKDLREATPPRQWAHREAPHFDDIREALEVEHQRQFSAAQRAQALQALRSENRNGSSSDSDSKDEDGEKAAEEVFMHRMASKAAATVEESVRNVCDLVRAELVQSRNK